MGLRKNVAALSEGERSRFVRACLELKRRGTWDKFVEIHRGSMFDLARDPAHMGAGFLPWHREYLKRFEAALQGVDRSVTVPWWDFARDHSPTSAPWTDDLLGGDGLPLGEWEVTTGPFAYRTGRWTLEVNDAPGWRPFLRRALGAGAPLPTQTDVDRAMAVGSYDSASYDHDADPGSSFRASLERMLHNNVHLWVGETMLAGSAPNDPVFFLVHCNVDRLWALWQARHPGQGYLPSSGAPQGHNLNDPMWPWGGEASPPTAAKVWDHKRLGYRYGFESG